MELNDIDCTIEDCSGMVSIYCVQFIINVVDFRIVLHSYLCSALRIVQVDYEEGVGVVVFVVESLVYFELDTLCFFSV